MVGEWGLEIRDWAPQLRDAPPRSRDTLSRAYARIGEWRLGELLLTSRMPETRRRMGGTRLRALTRGLGIGGSGVGIRDWKLAWCEHDLGV